MKPLFTFCFNSIVNFASSDFKNSIYLQSKQEFTALKTWNWFLMHQLSNTTKAALCW